MARDRDVPKLGCRCTEEDSAKNAPARCGKQSCRESPATCSDDPAIEDAEVLNKDRSLRDVDCCGPDSVDDHNELDYQNCIDSAWLRTILANAREDCGTNRSGNDPAEEL